MRRASLHQLLVFDTVVRQGGISAAARRLHLTQPAISAQLKELEHRLGLVLIDRSRRHTTDAGARLLVHARRILAEIEQGEDTLAALKGLAAGRLALASVSTAQYFVPRLLMDYWRIHPELKVRLSINNRSTTVAALAEGESELVIMGRPPPEIKTVATAFAAHPFVVIAPPGHPVVGRQDLSLESLASEPWLLREPGSGTRALAEEAFRHAQLHLEASMETSNNETIKQAVAAGMGLAIISSHTLNLELQTRRLVVLDVKGFPVVRSWQLIQRAGEMLSPAALSFRDYLLTEAPYIMEHLFNPV